MTDAQSDAKAVFFAALDCQSPAELAAYLDQACEGDTALRARVEQLLQAHQDAGNFLNRPALRPPATLDQPIAELPGSIIGPYKLLEQIGEGGFGVVFMAEQTQPIQRKVALKVIKPGMDTQQVIARFEAERQALALMDHPNIAKVLDAGATQSGRPFFVMELVRGVPLTQFCDRIQLPISQRLELFVSVCQAVQHAHQKGIIHRDLKPTNVLVTLHDGRPVVKVIDFGVAKAIAQKLTEKTFFTGFSQLIGTPLYMSPEQAEMSGLDVDTRSDVYSLGVLMYELLTGTTPFDSQRLKSAAFDELRRIIREEEPPRPSTRLSTLAQQEMTTVCAQRNIEPQHLNRLFQGELDWIVMKSLEKDRTHRYETASALAADVERYLHDEPVQACPPTVMYRFRKYARRHKGVLIAAAAVLAALILGTVISTWQAFRANQAARRADAVSTFLIGAFRSTDTEFNGHEINISELLNRTAKELQTKFADDPRTKAQRLLAVIGRAYLGIGPASQVVPLLEQARDLRISTLGADNKESLDSLYILADAYQLAGRLADAAAMREEVLRLTKAKLGPNNAATIDAMNFLSRVLILQGKSAEAEARLREDLPSVRAHLAPDEQALSNRLRLLALALLQQDRFAEAEPLAREALKIQQIREPGKGGFFARVLIGWALMGQRKYVEAEPLLLSGYEGMHEGVGSGNPIYRVNLSQALWCVAQFYEATNQPEKAAEWKAKLAEYNKQLKTQQKHDPIVKPVDQSEG